MFDRHDPEHWQTLRFRKEQRDEEYRRRSIGEATYLRSIMHLGYNEREARTELSLLKMEQRQWTRITSVSLTRERFDGRPGFRTPH